MVIFIGFFYYKHQSHPFFIKGFVSQYRSGVENTKVTTSLGKIQNGGCGST
jgi:hypothetical protein